MISITPNSDASSTGTGIADIVKSEFLLLRLLFCDSTGSTADSDGFFPAIILREKQMTGSKSECSDRKEAFVLLCFLQEIEKVTNKKQKYMEMFQNEIINIKELKEYTNPLNEDIARLERELKLITSEIKEKDVLEKELTKTIKTVDDILNNQTITNAMLKTIIDVIQVDSDSNVEVRLKLLNEIGSTPTIITNFNDINTTVTESNIGT